MQDQGRGWCGWAEHSRKPDQEAMLEGSFNSKSSAVLTWHQPGKRLGKGQEKGQEAKSRLFKKKKKKNCNEI